MNITRHVIFDVDLSQFGGSALTDDIAVPKKRQAGLSWLADTCFT